VHQVAKVMQECGRHQRIAARLLLGLLDAIAACEIEVAVVTLVDPVDGLACAKVAEQRLVACMRAGDAPQHLSLERLAAGPLVLREHGSMTRLMKAAIRAAFLELRDAEVLRSFRVEGFAPTTDEAYNVLRDTARLLELDLSQMRG
jgi:hypothetical protein